MTVVSAPLLDARERYLAEFRAFAGNGAAGAPAWLRDIRARAIERFAELGFPTVKQEEWRFTNVAPLLEHRFALPGDDRVSIKADELQPLTLGGADAWRLVFVNGTYAPELSQVDGLPSGVRIGSLRAAFKTDPALAQRHLARYADWQQSAFAALNTAFLADGALVYVPAEMELDRPIELVFAAAPPLPDAAPAVAHTRTLVLVERGARAVVLENYVPLRDGIYWTNSVNEVSIGEGARLEHIRVQRDSRSGYHVATTHTQQARDSVLRLHPLALGAGLARHDIRTVLNGTGAELLLNGLYLLRGRQHADHQTVIDHAQPHGTSHEFFNGIVGEQAHGVFSGRIIVRPHAQRTDSKQTNNNLLLSTEARADSQPQLEIYADDVKCTHGSTVGPFDQTALYYLRSRGLSAEMAAAILTYGLAAEILNRVEHVVVRDGLERVVRGRLASRSRGGRRG